MQVDHERPDLSPAGIARRLGDGELVRCLKSLVGVEQTRRAELIAHIIEFDRRMLYAEEGYSSLWDYCVRALGYSEAEAGWRVYTARAAQTFPLILEMLEAGRIHMTAVVLLAPLLTEENHRDLLEKAAGKSRRELEGMIVELSLDGELAAAAHRLNGMARQMIRPMPGGQVRFSFVGDQDLLRHVERSREVLRHKFPSGRLREVFGEGIDELLERRDPDRRLAAKEQRRLRKPAPPAGAPIAPGGDEDGADMQERACEPEPAAAEDDGAAGKMPPARRIPQSVKEEVWRRDGGCCAWVTPAGRRCYKREWLEYDHIIPWAKGGRSEDAGNVRLLCRTHNRLAGLKVFGEKAMRLKRP